MPSSSRRFTSEASVYRADGTVSCPSGSSPSRASGPSARDQVADAQLRQQRLLVAELGSGVVGALDVRAQVAGELDRLARRAEDGRPVRTVGGDLEARAQHARIGHLGGDGALPDQIVEALLIGPDSALDRARRLAEVGRSNRLVRLLRVLHGRSVLARPAVDTRCRRDRGSRPTPRRGPARSAWSSRCGGTR